MPGGKYKIAIVEDEKDLAEIYNLKMNMEGIETIVIHDSTKALDVLRQSKPDLVLLDILMPDINGFQLFEKIKADKDLKKLRVYIWSNLTQKRDREKAEKLHVDGYLIKSDYTPATLVDKVKELLKK